VEVFQGRQQENNQHIDSPPSMSFCDTPKHEDDLSWISSPKDSVFPETIPEEASSLEEERVVIFRLQPGCDHVGDTSYYTADASLLHHSAFKRNYKMPTSISGLPKHDKTTTRFDFDKIETYDRSSVRYLKV
jgi:hypothetical protein